MGATCWTAKAEKVGAAIWITTAFYTPPNPHTNTHVKGVSICLHVLREEVIVVGYKLISLAKTARTVGRRQVD